MGMDVAMWVYVCCRCHLFTPILFICPKIPTTLIHATGISPRMGPMRGDKSMDATIIVGLLEMRPWNMYPHTTSDLNQPGIKIIRASPGCRR